MFKELKRLIYVISRRRDTKRDMQAQFIRYRLIDIHISIFATSFLMRRIPSLDSRQTAHDFVQRRQDSRHELTSGT